MRNSPRVRHSVVADTVDVFGIHEKDQPSSGGVVSLLREWRERRSVIRDGCDVNELPKDRSLSEGAERLLGLQEQCDDTRADIFSVMRKPDSQKIAEK